VAKSGAEGFDAKKMGTRRAMRKRTTLAGAVAALVAFTAIVGGGTAAVRAAPTITDFTPKSGSEGTKVTITGANLAGARVEFFGVAATGVAVNSAGTVITATVPAPPMSGANEGAPPPSPVSVRTPGGAATSDANFVYTAAATSASPASNAPSASTPSPSTSGANGAATRAPRIVSFTPASGRVGTKVHILGKNLSGAIWVKLGGIRVAHFTVLSGTSLTATVPRHARSGAILIHTPTGTTASSRRFTVKAAAGL
jgi:hypothetical protein